MRARHPLLLPAVALALGSALGATGCRYPPTLIAALPAVVLPAVAPLAFASAGWLAASLARASPLLPPDGAVAVEGTVSSVPSALGERARFLLDTRRWGRLEVTADEPEWPLALGDRVALRARLRVPQGPRNPGGRDARGRLLALGGALEGIGEGPLVRVAPPSPLAWIERARRRWAEATQALPAREAGILRAIGTGDRGGLEPATSTAFARSGLAHVLAVSGLHLVVVAWGLFRAVAAVAVRIDRLAVLLDARRLAAAVALPATFVYALATGAGPPVLRAAVGAAAAFVAVWIRRELDPVGALSIAAIAVLAAEPGSILDPSLQLSFAAVGGLALWAGRLRAALPWPRPRPGTWPARLVEPFVEGGCATLAASIATAPILAHHFRQLPLLGLLANVAAVPIGAALTALGAIGALAASVSPALALPVLFAAWPFARALAALADGAAAPAWGALHVARPLLALSVAAFALALLATRLRGAVRWAAAAAAAACLLLSGPLRAAAARERGGLEVLFLSVGQGDAALLRLPDGGAVLVDAGGTPGGGPDPGEREVVPLLRDLGIRRLDAVFASHPHPDHVLGLRAVGQAVAVGRLFGNGDAPQGESAEALDALPSPVPLAAGQGWARGGVRFDVLAGAGTGRSGNDASLVLRVRFGSTTFLLPGDVEAAAEGALVSGGGLAADVVKVPHHGSRTSSSAPFAEAVRPRYAVVSFGRGNRHGFPHAEALARWTAVGAEIAGTADGAVRFLSDGRSLRRLPAEDVLDPIAILGERSGLDGRQEATP